MSGVPSAPEQQARRGVRRMLATLLFGHDYFLSYSRQDGAAYAGTLSNALERRGLLVCLDRTDFDPGSSLSRSLKRRVERSHRLLLVDTAGARQSKYVAEEIGHAIRRKRAIVRIADTTANDADWKYVDPEGIGIDDIISVDEPPLGIASGAPSAGVLDDVLRTGRKTRSLRRLTLAAVALAAVFAVVAISAWRLREMAASRELAAESTRLVETVPVDALALAVQAAERSGTDEARRALSRALSSQRLLQVLPDLHGEYAAFSADGLLVATVGVDGTQHVWDAQSGEELLTVADPAAGSGDAASGPWPAAQRARLQELCRKSRLSLPLLTRDCSRFVTNGDRGRRAAAARVWDVASGRALSDLADHAAIGHISANGLVVVRGDGAQLRIWNVSTGRLERDLEPCPLGSVNAARFSNDEARVVVAGDTGACVWDLLAQGRPVPLSGHTGRVTDAAFSPDGKRIVTAGEDWTARIWDAQSGTETAVFGAHKAPVTHAEFSADGRRLLTTSGEDPSYPPDGPDEGVLHNFDPVARVWDTGSSALLYELLMGEDENIVRYAAFSPDGTRIVTAGDGPTRIWTDNARRLDHEPTGRSAAAAAGDMTISPDGTLAIEGATVRRVAAGEQVFTLDGEPLAAAFSLDGARIVAVLPKTILVVDARTGSVLETIEIEYIDELERAMISPDRTTVAGTHSYYTKTTLWDTRDRRTVEVDGNVEGWSPDGRAIVTTFERARSAIVWDADAGGRLQTFPGGTNGVTGAGFSPDGTMVVTTDGNGVTRIWEARTGREHDVLPRHTGQVTAEFSGDGRFVHVADGRGATSVYPIRFTELLELAKARLPRSVQKSSE